MEVDLRIELATVLANAPILSSCNRQDVARLAPHAEEIRILSGDKLFASNQPADKSYLLCSGAVKLLFNGNEVDMVSSGFLGEEAALNMCTYLADAIAVKPLLVIAIPRTSLELLLRNSPSTLSDFSASLINHFVESDSALVLQESGKKTDKAASLEQPIGWLAAMAIPALVYYYCTIQGIDSRIVNFLAVFSATTVMWIFRLLPEFIPAVFLVLASIILGIVPTKTVLSGFASGSFFMAMSVFGIGAVLIRSGLTYRIALWLLKRSPQSQVGYQLSLLLLGLLLTPLLPSANARVTLTLPLQYWGQTR